MRAEGTGRRGREGEIPFDRLRAGSRGTFGMTREGGWVGDGVLTGDLCAARGWLRGRGRLETGPYEIWDEQGTAAVDSVSDYVVRRWGVKGWRG